MSDVIHVIQALSSLASCLWPLVVVVALVVYREPIRQLIPRLKRGKFLGSEIELSEIKIIEERIAQAEREKLPAGLRSPRAKATDARTPGARPRVTPNRSLNAGVPIDAGTGADKIVRTILDEAARSPSVALLRTKREVDFAVIRVVAHLTQTDGPIQTVDDALEILRNATKDAPDYGEKDMLNTFVATLADFNEMVSAALRLPYPVQHQAVLRTINIGLDRLDYLYAMLQERPSGTGE